MGKNDDRRELAYEVYAGLWKSAKKWNMEDVRRELEAGHGVRVSLKALYRWQEEGGWREALRGPSRKEMMLRDLLEVIDRLKARLKEAPAVDPQVVYAYSGLLNTFFSLSRNFPMNKIAPAEACPDDGKAPRPAEGGL